MECITIDIETRSDGDIMKCGVYAYADSPYFDILLFSYSIDGGAVQVIDLANGEKIPDEILKAFTDETIIKQAFNVNFERVCLSVYVRRNYSQYFKGYEENYFNPVGWHCTMIHSRYLSLPSSLAEVGRVLKIQEQKMTEGKALIKFFCVPYKTDDGESEFHNPVLYPSKWEMFKAYNKRDVEAELEIDRRIAKYPVPDFVWEEFYLDQEINDRGIRIDLQLAQNAVALDEHIKAELSAEMCRLTGVENPNSVYQLLKWLEQQGYSSASLGKEEVAELLKTAEEPVRSVLALRQKLAKSSVKKYTAMTNMVCSDDRARGTFSFLGASRTGRWCLTGDHEVLTPDGWVRLDEWNGGRIACWNNKSEAVSFQKAEQVHFDYDGPMYLYKDGRIDQYSTPNHKMWVQKRYGDEWQAMTVEKMASVRPCIPITGYRYHRGCANPAWLRVLIMTQADGHYVEDGGIRFRFKKQRKIERCKHLLRKAEIMFTTHQYSDAVVISIPAREVPLWLREFRTKTFGFWILDENSDIFFDELPNWDGYCPAPNSIQYSTCNKQNADIVQALAHMSGRTANIRVKHHNALKANWQDAYIVDIWLTPKNCHEIKAKPIVEQFSGKVYCAVTQTGYFLVRRNGKVWITGNSGRNIQLQNLPQNHISDLAGTREIIRSGDFELAEMLYDNIPDILSQLIRTALVPREDYKFIVADFSSIEARVLAWLAGETWRMQAFARGDDIYCASASKMFGVPVVKHGVNGHLRQKGKVAELACIAEGQLVLTNHGLIPIEKVTTNDKVWDGESWVEHDGVIYKGEREVITYEGLTATPDHLVFYMNHYLPFGEIAGKQTETKGMQKVYDIRNAGRHHRFTVSGKLVHNCGYGGSIGAMKAMGGSAMGLSDSELKKIVTDWRTASPNIVKLWYAVDNAAMTAVIQRTTTETHGIKFIYQNGILFVELPSKRRLAYIRPQIDVNRFGGDSLTYEGVGTTKKWERLETYGAKIVENCIAEGTLVITDSGLVPIECITKEMKIWDGIEWVSHDGLIAEGIRTTIDVDGIRMTPEHKILTTKGWIESGKAQGLDWTDVLLPDSYQKGRKYIIWKSPMALSMYLRKSESNSQQGFMQKNTSDKILWLHEIQADFTSPKNTRNEPSSDLGCLALYETTVSGFQPLCLSQLWWQRDYSLQTLAGVLRELLGRYGFNVEKGTGYRQNRQQQGIHSGKLPMGNQKAEQQKQAEQSYHRHSSWRDDNHRIFRADRHRSNDNLLPARTWLERTISVDTSGLPQLVYDIRNCGSRHRFAVWNGRRACIVSNCVQGIARDLLCHSMKTLSDCRIVAHVHDELIIEADGNMSVEAVCERTAEVPDWAEGLQLRADGFESEFYKKD